MASPLNTLSELVKPARRTSLRPRVAGTLDAGLVWPLPTNMLDPSAIACLLEIGSESFSHKRTS